jgi:glycosyltransferase involved in cell wall biosynthesis
MRDHRLRLVALMTHPVQYLAPWFRHIHAHANSIDLQVVYATEPTPQQQGVGFDRDFSWDVPLCVGYDSMIVRPAHTGVSLDSDRFLGLDVPEAVDAVRQLTPDVVLIAGWHSATQVRAIRALARDGVPLLYRGDTHLGSMSTRHAWLSRLRARVMLRQFSGYLAVGSRAHDYLRAMGVSDPAIVRSPHAVDNDAFRLRADAARGRRAEIRTAYGCPGDQRVVLYVGKLTKIKRPRDVIDAVARLERGVALFVGDGPERAALEAYAHEHKVACIFAGFLNQQEIANAYVAADALMLPGRETWGLVANEALASGLPVVMSTDAGAAPDLASAGVCVAVPPGHAVRFAQALHEVIERQRTGQSSTRDCQSAVQAHSFAEATRGLEAAAVSVHRNRQQANVTAPARVVALCGNLVFAGGMERITFEALSSLVRGGADVHALLNGWSSRPIAELAERHGVTWEVGNYGARLDGVFTHPRRMLRALADVAMASSQLGTLLFQRRVTHVLAVDFRAVLVHAPALWLCRILRIPVLLRSGVPPTRTARHAFLWRRIISPLVSRHIANSAFTAAELRAVGVPSQRIVTIHNVAPVRESEEVEFVRQPGRIAYVGQIIPEKGVLQLLDAVGLLIAQGLDVTIDVAGQMEGWAPETVYAYRSALRARAAQPDLMGRVRFLGWQENISAILRQASVHCCPSQPEQREGFGITVVEAKRAGVPSVVCPSGALPELIEHHRDGVVAEGFDAAAIADGLEWLLAEPGRLAQAQEAALASSRHFDPLVFERRWQQAFDMRPATPERSADGMLANVQGASR